MLEEQRIAEAERRCLEQAKLSYEAAMKNAISDQLQRQSVAFDQDKSASLELLRQRYLESVSSIQQEVTNCLQNNAQSASSFQTVLERERRLVVERLSNYYDSLLTCIVKASSQGRAGVKQAIREFQETQKHAAAFTTSMHEKSILTPATTPAASPIQDSTPTTASSTKLAELLSRSSELLGDEHLQLPAEKTPDGKAKSLLTPSPTPPDGRDQSRLSIDTLGASPFSSTY